MTFWNLYFILKLYLYASGHLSPLWLANIALAVALAFGSLVRRRAWRVVHLLAGLALAIPLMYSEAHVPPFRRLVEEFGALTTFSAGYWVELLQRFVSPRMLLAALGLVVVYLLVNRVVRVASFVLLALVALPAWQAGHTALLQAHAGPSPGLERVALNTAAGTPASAGPDAVLAAFRAQEARRQVHLARPETGANEQFDIIVLHICSLSWDDLDVAKARNHPMLSHFNFLFTNFSTAASYSGPAAIRVLRATCGQQPHDDLYKPVPAQCHLLAQLAQAGYTPQTLLNHDGHFGGFAQQVADNVGAANATALSNADVAVAMHAFDGSPVRGDYAALASWEARRASVRGPVALYYNTITLHDGNRLPDSDLGSVESYPRRVTTMMSDFDRFADLVAASGRRAVILFVPEHGAALRGDKNQVAGLRELPSPRIVHGPVGVRLIGFPGPAQPTTVIASPTSFLALAQLLANLLANNPFKPGVTLSTYAADLPQTRMVGENEATVTLRTAAGYTVKTPDGVWLDEQ